MDSNSKAAKKGSRDLSNDAPRKASTGSPEPYSNAHLTYGMASAPMVGESDDSGYVDALRKASLPSQDDARSPRAAPRAASPRPTYGKSPREYVANNDNHVTYLKDTTSPTPSPRKTKAIFPLHAPVLSLPKMPRLSTPNPAPGTKPNPCTITGVELWQEYRVIDPKWIYKLRWDLVMIGLLLFIAIVTPFEVAFMTLGNNPMYVLNRIVDVFFIADMLVNFFTAYYDLEESKVIFNQGRIATRYLYGWFIVDLCSVLPYDPVVLEIQKSGDDRYNRLRVLRLVKLLRLGRLPRIVKEGEVFSSDTQKIDYNLLNLLAFFLGILYFSHLLACFWKLMPLLEGRSESWLTGEYDDDYYTYDPLGVGTVYVASLYWAVMTVTTIGYGDVVPLTAGERIFTIMAMLMGGLIFGYIIGAVSNVVQQRSAKENAYYTGLTNLNLFMGDMRLPLRLQAEIRQYYKRLQASIDIESYLHYKDILSPALRGQMLLHSNQAWIQRVQHFRNAPQEFVVEVANVLTRHLFTPRETVLSTGAPINEMYIVNKGIAAGNNRLFTIGHLLGNDALVRASTSVSKRTYNAHAITFLECSRLDKEHLFEILDNFPKQRDRFRILAVQSIFREEVMAYCIAMRTMKLRKRAHKYRASHRVSVEVKIEDEEGASPRDDLNFDGLGDDFWDNAETTRVRDLFNKSARTDFYTQKLSVIYPESDRRRRVIENAARKLQQVIRRFLHRRRKMNMNIGLVQSLAVAPDLVAGPVSQETMEAAMKAAQAAGGNAMSLQDNVDIRLYLKELADNQKKMMSCMAAIGQQQQRILDELFVVQADARPKYPAVRHPAKTGAKIGMLKDELSQDILADELGVPDLPLPNQIPSTIL